MLLKHSFFLILCANNVTMMLKNCVERQRSDAVRTEPIIVDGQGRTFWKLKVYKGEPDVLLQGWFRHTADSM